MKNTKKIIYGLGVIAMVATPISVIISCGKETPQKKELKLDGVTINSVTQLITTLDSKMHFISKEPADIIADISQPQDPEYKKLGYPLPRERYEQIASGVITDVTFKLTYGDKSQTFKTDFHSDTSIVKESITKMLSDQTVEEGKKAKERMTARISQAMGLDPTKPTTPNFITYVAILTNTIGLKTMGYLSIPDEGWNAYLHELVTWTNFTWEINTSDVYKEWLSSNPGTYLEPKIGTAPNTNGQIDQDKLIDPTKITDDHQGEINGGIDWDKASAIPLMKNKKEGASNAPGAQPNKVSNLSMQFVYMIQRLYALQK